MKEVNTSTAVGKRVLDTRELSDSVLTTCRKVLDLILRDEDVADDLGPKFEAALTDIVSVQIAPLEKQFGAFRVNDGVLTLNEADAANLIAYVIEDMKAQVRRGTGAVSKEDVKQTLEDTLALFALHELRHRTQGVSEFADVQRLKQIVGRDQIAKFDIQADRDAAIALAAAQSDGLNTDEFLTRYQNALFYSVHYFFRIYPANVDRQDKVCRVAALLFMLVRLELYRTIGTLACAEPTTALCVRFSSDRNSVAVFEGSPNERLLVASNDHPEISLLMSDIEDGRLDDALGRAFSVILAIGLN